MQDFNKIIKIFFTPSFNAFPPFTVHSVQPRCVAMNRLGSVCSYLDPVFANCSSFIFLSVDIS